MPNCEQGYEGSSESEAHCRSAWVTSLSSNSITDEHVRLAVLRHRLMPRWTQGGDIPHAPYFADPPPGAKRIGRGR
ncbi:hypothetical protein LMH87_003342 [Akanthomyces muscarius]|uniref:Uncharacterized protein n=1 Tax=Akanthomyces muscarius TaxID=2231603 RepID=A0A9W8Q2D5_AKAMU|nr:hypothetical protein LMH87_003342 [Akanthomyces muscarius]KAJ4144460.1 hypothetical protein LMH87_003342 [Akanthomyces muscarius]